MSFIGYSAVSESPMRYPMPNYPCEFEIPDAWLTEAGINGFTPTAPSYRSTGAAVPMALREIEQPYRVPELDWRGFDRGRLISVLKGVATGPRSSWFHC
jgi:hypothetical protein